MKREDDQELWDLLGKTSQPAISPFFSRNVVRRVREVGGSRYFASWFSLGKLIPAAAIVLVLGLTTLSIHRSTEKDETDNLPEVVSVIDPQDYEVVADLDDLLASEDDNVWDDTESLSL